MDIVKQMLKELEICLYCEDISNLDDTETGLDGLELATKDGKYYAKVYIDDYFYYWEVDYCLKCGRKLKKGSE